METGRSWSSRQTDNGGRGRVGGPAIGDDEATLAAELVGNTLYESPASASVTLPIDATRESAPEAEERISYQMPGYFLNGQLVWFGVHKHHIGFYPTGSGIEAFKDELSAYKSAKGSVQFPLDEPMPYELIRKIVKFRVGENLRKKK